MSASDLHPVQAGAPQGRRQILVTSALPYANGQIHIGHLVEYIQTDIWARTMRMHGHEIYYIGADDTHGTPVMLRAEQEGVSPKQLIERVWREHKRDFDSFGVSFDNFYTTDSDENRVLSEKIYLALKEAGFIAEREIEQAYDPVKQMFLPDRFIKGECPKCHAKDQYGDSCEVCGTTYQPTDLVNPYSVVSGATPVRKTSTHHFFRLSDPRCEAFLREWVSGLAQPEATNKMREWLGDAGEAKLADWDISRDAPYFGFEIPGAPGKYFYVWLDAPVGYYASFKNLCERRGLDFDAWISKDSTTEQYHFIGKDILYFHTLFWPAMLEFSGHRTPTNVFAHGFLTVDGAKMSKSRGTFITAQSYIDAGLNPEWLRYYFAAKLNATMEDIDLNLEDFQARVNSDLVGKYVNIASRAAGFLIKRFDGRVQASATNHPLLVTLRDAIPQIAAHYEAREYGRALRQTMELADAVNGYVDTAKPWELAKDPANAVALHETCTVSLEAFRLLSLALKPVLPRVAEGVEAFLGIAPLTWADANKPLSSEQPIRAYQHLMTRVDPKQIDALLAANRSSLQGAAAADAAGATNGNGAKAAKSAKAANAASADDEASPFISIDDFAKIDLRIAKIVACQAVEGSDKLLQLTLDVGEEKTRNVFSGIKSAYQPEQLVGKLTVMVANLAPRKMKFGLSEGMVLAASAADEKAEPGLYILEPHSGAKPGMRVK
ncbi:methionine--tRNA ligase [Burkholderia thailandensis]|uniref:Methionine--tRNA ligase n=1 Tax=Burkholderia thailandensis (strain ATCC 700388 / DSM 13276 / CCUG 48851 / CIP 106301 / E264) TaxID=271848 RepID=SYM_BURTA|nr:methionine--tRNA ligase [Burkholderia thailandensis]Q2T087.2 RecName: Full=Methionine--tRNA ligase; AltName: Full=Methionyl-tRNA synthetase; Short=MetRS [Burkholderia thailandensis E264]AHI73932.1 methionine--tRNA ligase [Burkholderia thailandensis 2002721723]AHI77507.1 methionine--tRNA ligase [Burkholderia thailandensis E444]AIC85753.1 methionine--tRNA ligase [Burkholderia thailandensis USAMRU Malaysia \